MNLKPVIAHRLFKPIVGSLLTAVGGLALWALPATEVWRTGSYDALFRFGTRQPKGPTNGLAIIFLEKDPDGSLRRQRVELTQLLNKLADDGCRLVVLDILLRTTNANAGVDQDLARAIRRQRGIVLMAEQKRVTWQSSSQPSAVAGEPILACEPFLTAAGKTNWGVAWFDPDPSDRVTRRHWPSEERPSYPSLAEAAARLTGAALVDDPEDRPNRWLRYYGPTGPWIGLSHQLALTNKPGFFADKIVFVGARPSTTFPGDEDDEFLTPYTRFTGETVGGVELHATAFLNLINDEWLRRFSWWVEIAIILLLGSGLGALLTRLRPLTATALGLGLAVTGSLAAVSWSHFNNHWFPWLIVVGGQIPCAIAWTWIIALGRPRPSLHRPTAIPPKPALDAHDYELFEPAFGQGAYGKVWLVRNSVGQWQALKAIYRAKFGPHTEPYDREFRGIRNYKPISDKYPGLLHVDFVSVKKEEGYFYYVMELGDAEKPGWEKDPSTYRPQDLSSRLAQSPGHELPVAECVRILLALTEAVEFLHSEGFAHRDIKPSNVIFVKGCPKLADVGLVRETHPEGDEMTFVGTPGYMPPGPEFPGTIAADVYALGMMLYVISTGQAPASFPEISTRLVANETPLRFMKLNAIILKACHPDRIMRYASAAAMHEALLDLQSSPAD